MVLAQGTTYAGPGILHTRPSRGPRDRFSQAAGTWRRSAIVGTGERVLSPDSWGCLPLEGVFENLGGVGNGPLATTARVATREPQTRQGLHSRPARRRAYTNDRG